MMMAKVAFGLVVAADYYQYYAVGASSFSSSRDSLVTAGTWSSQSWASFENMALYSAIGKGTLMLAAMFVEPIADMFGIVALLSLGQEIYQFTLLSTAKDSSYEDTDMESMQQIAIGTAAGLSAFVAVAKMMKGGDDDEEEADYYYEEEAPAEEPVEEPTDDGGDDGYGSYYGYYY